MSKGAGSSFTSVPFSTHRVGKDLSGFGGSVKDGHGEAKRGLLPLSFSVREGLGSH